MKTKRKRKKRPAPIRILGEILDRAAGRKANHLANDSSPRGGRGAKIRGILERERRVYLDEMDQW